MTALRAHHVLATGNYVSNYHPNPRSQARPQAPNSKSFVSWLSWCILPGGTTRYNYTGTEKATRFCQETTRNQPGLQKHSQVFKQNQPGLQKTTRFTKIISQVYRKSTRCTEQQPGKINQVYRKSTGKKINQVSRKSTRFRAHQPGLRQINQV